MHEDLIRKLRDWASDRYELQAGEIPDMQRDVALAADALEAMQVDARRLTWLGNGGWENLPYADQWQGADWLRSAIDAAMTHPQGSAQR